MPKPKKIPARAVADDNKISVEFDALPWFRQANNWMIARLARKDFQRSDEADAVAEHCAQFEPGLRNLMDYLQRLNAAQVTCGYEVVIDSDAALEWLRKRDEYRAGVNPNATLRYAHRLHDGEPGHEGSTCEVIMEADAGWASIGVFNEAGEHVGDVTVEVRKNMVTARVWKQDDIGNDPTSKVDLCVNPSKVLDWRVSTRDHRFKLIDEWQIEKRLAHEAREEMEADARLKKEGVAGYAIEVDLSQA